MDAHPDTKLLSSSRFAVALEFNYPSSKILKALKTHKFQNAGDLVGYLYEHIDSDSDEDDKDLTSDSNITAAITDELNNVNLNLTLMQETSMLLSGSLCINCRLDKREILCLPCCHFSLCRKCRKTVVKCPWKDCDESILDTIPVFLA